MYYRPINRKVPSLSEMLFGQAINNVPDDLQFLRKQQLNMMEKEKWLLLAPQVRNFPFNLLGHFYVQ